MNELALLRLRVSLLPLLLRADSQRLEILDELSMGLELLSGCAIELLDLEEHRRPLLCFFGNQILGILYNVVVLFLCHTHGAKVLVVIRTSWLNAEVQSGLFLLATLAFRQLLQVTHKLLCALRECRLRTHYIIIIKDVTQ